MDGVLFLLNLAGEALARAQQELAQLRAENEQLRQTLADRPST